MRFLVDETLQGNDIVGGVKYPFRNEAPLTREDIEVDTVNQGINLSLGRSKE